MITLTHRAEQCLKVLHALDRRELLMAEAAELLGRSVRQVRRLRAALQTRGLAALVHGNHGRPPVNRIPNNIRACVVRLARKLYVGLNDHHFHELLVEREGLALSRPSIRRILRAAGLPSPRRRRAPRHRRRRQRMPQAGLLVQLDGSTHAWLDQRGPRLTLIAAIDDATGEVLAATFREEEDAHGYFQVLHTLAHTKGIPIAVYSDRHGIFHRSKTTRLTLEEQLVGEPASTQVARALAELAIHWIPAQSPQAKGRIERLWDLPGSPAGRTASRSRRRPRGGQCLPSRLPATLQCTLRATADASDLRLSSLAHGPRSAHHLLLQVPAHRAQRPHGPPRRRTDPAPARSPTAGLCERGGRGPRTSRRAHRCLLPGDTYPVPATSLHTIDRPRPRAQKPAHASGPHRRAAQPFEEGECGCSPIPPNASWGH